jgi:cyanobactin maturation PatA/PatG family protease
MNISAALPDLGLLQADSLGEEEVVIAVLDGPVALDHPALQGADLRRLDTLVQEPAGMGPMSRHGTHVTSLIFGQPGSPVPGVAPRCRGLIVPVFREEQRHRLPQLDLARAIEQSVEEGAHVINISGGERSPTGEPEGPLRHALEFCADRNVLVVAAGGNDGCECLHVPAAFPTVLAVGASGRDGEPLATSNWGEPYRSNGVLAPGEDIAGAVPGGGTKEMTGSSFATPLVTGVVALLLGYQLRSQTPVNPNAAAHLVRATARPCLPRASPECRRDYRGALDISAARAAVLGGTDTMTEVNEIQASSLPATPSEISSAPPADPPSGPDPGAMSVEPSATPAAGGEAPPGPATVAGSPVPGVAASAGAPPPAGADTESRAVTPSCGNGNGNGSSDAPASCGCKGSKSLVYAIGQIGFDFGTEARRDTFRQLMPPVIVQQGDGTPQQPQQQVAPNPYAIDQLTDYLDNRPSECTKVIWTLNLDLTPIYAVVAEPDAYADEVYKVLRTSLRCSALSPDSPDYISRISVPGVLTNRTVRLFSGQVLPVVVAQPRGLYAWSETTLVTTAVTQYMATQPQQEQPSDADIAAGGVAGPITPDMVALAVRIFLDKIYFELRNLGYTSSDRALNYAGTNAFMFIEGIVQGLAAGNKIPGIEPVLYSLDTISVSKSPYCRLDSDCWDVQISFFNPNNERQARVVWQYTIDVSDEMPVSLAPPHQFLMTS